MKFFQFLIMAGLLTVVSCSQGTTDDGGEEIATEETAEADEDGLEITDSEADFIVDGEEDEDLVVEDDDEVLSDEATEDGGEEPLLEESVASAPQDEGMVEEVPPPAQHESMQHGGASESYAGGGEGSYTVKPGETLMMIAFNIYGDYRRWKELARMNGVSGDLISSGTVIRYRKPATEFVWNPEGLPYLIKHGDTLGTIAEDKYGTAGRWRSIYNNNRPLIKDPNLIFAGFTLYYIPDRDLASE